MPVSCFLSEPTRFHRAIVFLERFGRGGRGKLLRVPTCTCWVHQLELERVGSAAQIRRPVVGRLEFPYKSDIPVLRFWSRGPSRYGGVPVPPVSGRLCRSVTLEDPPLEDRKKLIRMHPVTPSTQQHNRDNDIPG